MNSRHHLNILAKKLVAVFSASLLLCCNSVYAQELIGDLKAADEASNRLEMPAESQAQPDQVDKYVLGPGDWVGIADVYDEYKQQQNVPVGQDGNITLYPFGYIKATGLTTLELGQVINNKAKELFSQSHFQVSLVQVRPVMVYVLGEVALPGRYQLSSSTDTVIPNVLTAIQAGGGLRETANVRRVQVRRGTERINVDLWKMASEGDNTQVVMLQPGDVVFASRGGDQFNPDGLGQLSAVRGRWVRILGSVRAPGIVELRPNDTLYSVVARAGGFATGAATRSVILSRMNRDGTIFTKRVSLVRGLKERDSLANAPVQSGDILVASTSLFKTVGVEVARAGMITALAMLIIYFSNKVHNVNVVSDEGAVDSGTTTPTTGTGS
jgi:protein involved in polysaccharide export with SLBB domain